jgi:hypothetical protein
MPFVSTSGKTTVHLDREVLENAMRLAYLLWQELGADEPADLEAPTRIELVYEALQASA